MKKLAVLILFSILSFSVHSQYRWEFSGGPIFSTLNLDNAETSSNTGFYLNAGYGYISGVRAKTSIVFSLEALQRSSEITGGGEASTFQVGFSPKFRYLMNTGKSQFRPFINVGPTLRVSTGFKIDGEELESNQFEPLIIGGVYGVGFSQMVGEMFDIFFEAGAMNDFTNNLKDLEGNAINSKFFDIYARVGVRFRIYDARR